ncbi:MAG: hypothetical protein NC336_04705 [Clostridium sp.]|nr:hypothetical protein [Clostridium sp.]
MLSEQSEQPKTFSAWLSDLKRRISGAVHSSRGKDVLLYLLFVCIAFVFWLLLSLDTEVQRDYDVPLAIENVPDSVTFISTVPPTINVGVQAKGSQLLQYSWGHLGTMKINFEDYVVDDNDWKLPPNKLESRVRDYFGNGVMINSIRPDSLNVVYTTLPGERVKVNIVSDITTNLEYILSGDLTANFDSVFAYSPEQTAPLSSVETDRIVRRDLKDTTYVEVKLRSVPGVRLIPDRVRVCIPVEALTLKKQEIRIETENVPENCNLLTFPSKVEISYLVPISRFKDNDPVEAYVDYNEIRSGRSHLRVHLSLLPHSMQHVTLSQDSVEYIIDRD